MDWIDELLREVGPYRHVHNREIPQEALDELMRRADRAQVRVLANMLPDGRVTVTLKKIMGTDGA